MSYGCIACCGLILEKVVGRRKTNLKKKKAARRQKAIMERIEEETQQKIQECFKFFFKKLHEECQARQESYRWN